MPATNRYNHYIEELETRLGTVSGLNVLSEFDMPKWKDYAFPYVYVMLNSSNKYDYHEDFGNDFNEEVIFDLWVAVETNSGEDIRSATNTMIFDIEKAFKDFKINNLTTDDFRLLRRGLVHINDYSIVDNTEETKQIFVLRGNLNVNYIWS